MTEPPFTPREWVGLVLLVLVGVGLALAAAATVLAKLIVPVIDDPSGGSADRDPVIGTDQMYGTRHAKLEQFINEPIDWTARGRLVAKAEHYRDWRDQVRADVQRYKQHSNDDEAA